MTSLAIENWGIHMSVANQRDFDIVSRILHGDLSMKEGALLLGKSYRQTKRIVRSVKNKGMLGVKHGNLGKKPWNKTEVETKEKVIFLLANKYNDFNLTHFREKLENDHKIYVRRETLRKWAHEKHLVKRAHHSRRPKVHKTRPRMPKAGMLLQLDGSIHRWFGPKKQEYCLIGNIDDATSSCEFAEFFLTEDTPSILQVLKATVERVGVPEFLYVDRAAWSGGKNIKRVDWEKHLTDVERAMRELGCRVLHAPSPQAKGRIERMWGTFQDRLVPEMRIRYIQRLEAANTFLQNHFIPEFNRKFGVIPRSPERVYKKVSKKIDLNEIFCMKDWRRIGNGETFSYNNQTYLVDHPFQYSLRKAQIEIRRYLDGSEKYFYANRQVTVRIIEPIRRAS